MINLITENDIKVLDDKISNIDNQMNEFKDSITNKIESIIAENNQNSSSNSLSSIKKIYVSDILPYKATDVVSDFKIEAIGEGSGEFVIGTLPNEAVNLGIGTVYSYVNGFPNGQMCGNKSDGITITTWGKLDYAIQAYYRLDISGLKANTKYTFRCIKEALLGYSDSSKPYGFKIADGNGKELGNLYNIDGEQNLKFSTLDSTIIKITFYPKSINNTDDVFCKYSHLTITEGDTDELLGFSPSEALQEWIIKAKWDVTDTSSNTLPINYKLFCTNSDYNNSKVYIEQLQENKSSFSIYKNIEDYEYLVPYGTDDWTDAFNQMAQDIGDKYHSLYIPNKIYKITKRIIIEGKKDIIIYSDFGTIFNTVQDASNSTAGTFYFRNCENILLENINHLGTDSSITSLLAGKYGLLFHGCTNVYIHRNHFDNFGDNSLLVAYESNQDVDKVKHGENFYVNECIFNNGWQTSTTTMGCMNYYFTNNVFKNMLGSCKFAQRYDLGSNLYVIGNVIEGCGFSTDIEGLKTGGKAFEMDNYNNVFCCNNIFKNHVNSGVFIMANPNADINRYVTIRDITIQNNIFENIGGTGILIDNCSKLVNQDNLQNNMNNIKIKDNTFNNIGKFSIYFKGMQPLDIAIEGNKFYNSGTSTINCNFSSNSLNSQGNPIVKNYNFRILKNTIRNALRPISILSGIHGLFIIDNFITCSQYAICLQSKPSDTAIDDSISIAKDIFIERNYIEMNDPNSEYTLAFSQYSNCVKNLIVRDNTIISNNLGFKLPTTSGATQVYINNIFKTNNYSIVCQGSGKFYLSNNIFLSGKTVSKNISDEGYIYDVAYMKQPGAMNLS